MATSVAPLKQASRFNRFDNPWLNPKLLIGVFLIFLILGGAFIGRFLWDTDLALVGSSPLKKPPVGFSHTTLRGTSVGTMEHPLGTDGDGRDMLAVMIVGAPRTLAIGFIAALAGMGIGILLGFTAGFMGGRVDDIIRIASDTTITIPSILVLIVIQSVIPVNLVGMALLISVFAWPGPTRLIRGQVLSMRESGYVKMARISGASTFDIMFKEMMPNLIPYLAASFIGNMQGSILAAIGLEVLGLGPQRVPTLGKSIYWSVQLSGLSQGLWWWWGFPALILVIIFIGLLLINLGLDEVSNPRLRQRVE
ncbi:MAG: ABC transporter permease [Deinococcales bacterium]